MKNFLSYRQCLGLDKPQRYFEATITRTHTFVDNAVLTAAQLNNEFDNALNALAIVNADISGSAAIAASKIAIDTDGTLAANSDTVIASQKATKTYADTKGAADGWIAATGTWTYASASTITVPSGAASLYRVGDKIKWTQTTVKYGVISAVADTVLTIIVNTDYTVANAAITLNYYSHDENPLGFPNDFK